MDEMRLFALQGKYLDALTPATTLYTVSFGIKYVFSFVVRESIFNYVS